MSIKAFQNRPYFLDCLTELEKEEAKKFRIQQREKKKDKPRSQRFSYIFIPGEIGVNVSIKDNLLKTEKDITDYGCW